MTTNDPRAWLAQVRAEAEAATEGPWSASGSWPFDVIGDTLDPDGGTKVLVAASEADSHFASSARTTVPALAAMVDAVLGLADAADVVATRDPDQECGTVHAHHLRTTLAALIPDGTNETEG